MYYKIEPEVAGGWGEGTKADTTTHPPKITDLVYEFEGWLGDSIVTTFPCYIVTVKLARSITQSKLTGYELSDCRVMKSDTFKELYPNKVLPKFKWLKIIGNFGVDDFGMGEDLSLVVSTAALSILKEHSLNECEIEALNV